MAVAEVANGMYQVRRDRYERGGEIASDELSDQMSQILPEIWTRLDGRVMLPGRNKEASVKKNTQMTKDNRFHD